MVKKSTFLPGSDKGESEKVKSPDGQKDASVPMSYVRPTNVSFDMEEIESETYSALNVVSFMNIMVVPKLRRKLRPPVFVVI